MSKLISIKGWVYIISNKSMPGFVKIGFSMRDPKNLAKELDSTGSPHPFEVAYAVLVQNPRKIEKIVHKVLNEYLEGKEWFGCSAKEARSAVDNVTQKMAVEFVVTHASKNQPSVMPEQRPVQSSARRAVHLSAAPKRVTAGTLFLNELRRFVASDENEFPIKETRLNTLWPASDSEMSQNGLIIFSLDKCYSWIRENNLNLVLNTANTPANLKAENLFQRDLVFHKYPNENLI